MATPAPGPAVFPPLQTETYGSQLFWLAISFGILYFVMSRLIAPRLAGIVQDRAERIGGDLDAAASARGRAEEAGQAYEKALAEAKAKAQAIAQEETAAANAKLDATRKELDAKLAAQLAESEARIASIKTKAMGNVAGIAADAAGAIVERLIGAAPAKAELKAAVDAAMKQE